MAIIQLGEAFKNFFSGRAHYPQFKKKGKNHDSFTSSNDQFTIETDDKTHLPPAENQGVVGVDLGIKAPASLSTCEIITGEKPLKQLPAKLKRLSRALSRKVNGSANPHKAKQKNSPIACTDCLYSTKHLASAYHPINSPFPYHRH